MKKFSENRTLGTIVLVVVALLAIPILGGLGLKIAERAAAREFASIAAKPDQHGNEIFTDTDDLIVAARAVLSEGKRLNQDGTGEFTARAEALEKAINACSREKDAIGRYLASEALILSEKQFYNLIRTGASDELNAFHSEVTSCESRMDRTYRAEYSDYINKRAELISAWPASSLAKLYNIGGAEK